MVEATESLSNVAGIVVHHNRHEEIKTVVAGLITAGLAADHILVVDNSERPDLESKLQDDLEHVTLVSTPNHGYGAAVNIGLTELNRRIPGVPYVLVATHEVQIDANSLLVLKQTLDSRSDLAGVGPTLFNADQPGDRNIWSQGGRLARFTGLPIHVRSSDDVSSVQSRDWLDGAVVLYRTSHLPFRPFDESFFLYMEEVDLHLRLGYAGTPVAWVPSAYARQSSSGTPPFLFARNLRLLHRKHGRGRLGLARLWPLMRRAASLLKRGRVRDLSKLIAGALVRLPTQNTGITVINPLGKTLAHYAREMHSIAADAGVSMTEVRIIEPSASGKSRAHWVAQYIRAMVLARRLRGSRDALVISVWPVLGFLDAILLRAIVGYSALVVHDPKPLVRSIGHDVLSQRLVGRVARRMKYVVHSPAASDELRRMNMSPGTIVEVAHPLLTPTTREQGRPKKIVRVLGQYKADRDLETMERVARELDQSWTLEVCGRGWPSVRGWNTDARFLTETEFDEKIRNATVIFVPYRRFYQSGVAVRALEVGTPVVGSEDSVLSDLIGDANLLITEDNSASTAIAYAATLEPNALQARTLRYREKAVRSFLTLMRDPRAY